MAELMILALVLYTGLVTRACYRMVFFPKPHDKSSLQEYEHLLSVIETLSKQNSELSVYVISLRSEVSELRRLVLREDY